MMRTMNRTGLNRCSAADFLWGIFERERLSHGRRRNRYLVVAASTEDELGRTRKNIADILNMTPGSVIELDKMAGEPVDVLVNSKLIAKGEVVVIDENFGVRITEIVSSAGRVHSL